MRNVFYLVILISNVLDQTACCYMFVEGNPAPTFKFYKVNVDFI